MNNEKNYHKDKGSNLLGIAVAMAIGAALGLIFAPKSGEEMRQETAEKAKEIARKFKKTREEVASTVKEIFGEINDELERNYIEIRANVLTMLEDLKERGEVTKENYQKMVEKTVKQFSKGKKWSETAIKKLREDLESSWDEIMEKK